MFYKIVYYDGFEEFIYITNILMFDKISISLNHERRTLQRSQTIDLSFNSVFKGRLVYLAYMK